MKWFERFCHRYERFGFKRLTTAIALGQCLVALMALFFGPTVLSLLTFHPVPFLAGEWWRLVTFLFVPYSGNALTMLLSAYFLFWLGRHLEMEWGAMKLTIYYLAGVLMALLYSLLTGAAATTFFLNMSLFFALATLHPDQTLLLFFVLPLRFKYVALAEAAIFILWPLLSIPFTLANLMPLTAVANYLLFFAPTLFKLVRRPLQTSRRTVEFKSEVRRTRERRGYIHKCAVCGITDAEAPDMEFRYCSLCAGYKCYCSEHIFNHVHTKIQ
ncbi:MAG: rhomboid family intramembrane serine protease [Oscillospiraceae bacterium]|jgi:membrane associated rhomboid family serine protease|nr:rhomboid family intramembrane serine protease [Oscillospiraceae bacterium]